MAVRQDLDHGSLVLLQKKGFVSRCNHRQGPPGSTNKLGRKTPRLKTFLHFLSGVFRFELAINIIAWY